MTFPDIEKKIKAFVMNLKNNNLIEQDISNQQDGESDKEDNSLMRKININDILCNDINEELILKEKLSAK